MKYKLKTQESLLKLEFELENSKKRISELEKSANNSTDWAIPVLLIGLIVVGYFAYKYRTLWIRAL